MHGLELLSPARNSDIGMAAIDCGADSVYIAAPKYGARQQAGNSFEDISRLCSYAHRFGAKIYLTLNTILYQDELKEAQAFLWQAHECGIDAVIVQDLALLKMERPPVPFFASTQTDIRTPEKAALLEKLGFQRLILARELTLKQIREIRKATSIPLESFVHGALCVSYSGQCYLSRYLTGRSANRGECAQACRSDYDLVDQDGRVLVKDSPLLSLKDMDRSSRLEDLIDAGITSFKIEGRLKNISYVKNIVRKYDLALNRIIAKDNAAGGVLCRSSLGHSRAGFTPDEDKTFNRGYTDFYLDGKRGRWKSLDSAKSMGQYIGKVGSVQGGGKSFVSFSYTPASDGNNLKDRTIHNSDGLCFVCGSKILSGNRASRCNGNTVELFTRETDIRKGDDIYRNYDAEFEKQLENIPARVMDVFLDIFLSDGHITVQAEGKRFRKTFTFFLKGERAENPDLAKSLVKNQLGKTALHFSFSVRSLDGDDIYFYRTSALNGIRNALASQLEAHLQENAKQQDELQAKGIAEKKELRPLAEKAFRDGGGSYLRNCSNSLAKEVYAELGMANVKPSYEQEPPKDAVLMRCKYCIRFQLGMCPNDGKKLYLRNGKNTLALEFDCKRCEMLVKALE